MTVDSQIGIPLGEPRGPFKRFRLQRWPVRPEVAVVMVILAMATVTLWISNIRLERRLEGESARVQGLSDLVEQVEQGRITSQDFEAARADLEGVISDTEARVRSLEAAAGARERVIDEASRSVGFVLGSYGFIDRATSLPLRYFVGQGRGPLLMPDNMQLVTTDGDGPFVRSFFTGTAFVATRGGLLITNRHVVRPWEYDADAQFALQAGFAPDPQRLIGYLPGVEEPFDIEIIAASNDADLALVRAAQTIVMPESLGISETPPDRGDEVVVLGYPAGVEALLARADPAFAEGLLSRGPVTFWEVGRALAIGGYIEPLATQGIIGQITETTIVYDAETASGGSGGPVVGLDGRVVAVNVAVLARFSGSNLGVPASHVLNLLRTAGESVEPERR